MIYEDMKVTDMHIRPQNKSNQKLLVFFKVNDYLLSYREGMNDKITDLPLTFICETKCNQFLKINDDSFIVREVNK
jgi:hypothetical protein